MAWWCFQNLVVTAGLAGAVALVCRFSRIGPVGRHALWLVVLVKFVTPPIVAWPWAMPDPLRVGTLSSITEPSARALAESRAEVNRSLVVATAATPASTMISRGETPPETTPASIWPWVAGLWIAGSLGVCVVEGVRIARLGRRVRHAGPADPDLIARVDALASRLDLPAIDVRIVRGQMTPSVWSLGRPVLLWPSELPAEISAHSLDGLIVHELAHIKRRDHWIGWLELAAGVVWWWNPLYWHVRSAVREQAELACDAWVISSLPDGRRAYAESLLAFSCLSPRTSSPMPVLGVGATTRRVLERRLIMIMQGRAPLRLTRIGGATLALVAAITLPGWVTAQTPPPPPPPAQAPTPPAARTQTAPTPPTMPPPPPARATRTSTQTAPTPPPPPPPARQVPPARWTVGVTPNWGPRVNLAQLPADGKELVGAFNTDQEAIQKEADAKVERRQQELVKKLEALQDSYTKAGKLDEAVAIRDYLKRLSSGGLSWTRTARLSSIKR